MSDHDWLLARERGEPYDAPADEQARYATLATMIAELPDQPLPTGRDEAVLAALARAPRPVRRWRRAATIAVPLLAAAIVLIVVWRRGPRDAPPPALAVTVEHGREVRRTSHAAIGDRIVATAPAAGARLRLYVNDGRLVAACPGGAACGEAGGRLTLAYTADAPGNYRAVVIGGDVALPGASFEDDLERARAAGATLVTAAPVEVR